MESVKSKRGYAFFPVLFIVMLLGALWTFQEEAQVHRDFKTYFSISPHLVGVEKNLAKPLVAKRIVELKDIASKSSSVVEAIRNEPESLVLEGLEDKLGRIREAQKAEKSAWSDWERACKSAKWESYVQTCDAAK